MEHYIMLRIKFVLMVSVVNLLNPFMSDIRTTAQQPARESEKLDAFRNWTDVYGRTISARLRDIKDRDVLLQRSDGKDGRIAVTRLSAADQLFVAYHAPNILDEDVDAATLRTIQSILARPEIKSAEKKLIEENTITETRSETVTVTRLVDEYYTERYCYRGRWCERLCRRQVSVSENITRLRAEVVQKIAEQTILDSPESNSVGNGLAILEVSSLPPSAGARASRIFSSSQSSLPNSILRTIQEEDRVLLAESVVFETVPDDPNTEQKVKLIASVRGLDNRVELVVLLAQRDRASQTPIIDKTKLNALAQGMAARFAQVLK
jgi:hypothetical protein